MEARAVPPDAADAGGGEPEVAEAADREPRAEQQEGDAPGRRLSDEERRRYERFVAEVFGRRCGGDRC